MNIISVIHNGESSPCQIYTPEDDPEILKVFFNWMLQETIASASGMKRPPLPSEFSIPFCCRILGLARKTRTAKNSPDCFEIEGSYDGAKITSAIEVKATITEDGFTDLKKNLDFDRLCWLDCSDYKNLKFSLIHFTRDELSGFVDGGKRDRTTVHLRAIAEILGRTPFFEGSIGISVEELEWEKNIKPKGNEEVLFALE